MVGVAVRVAAISRWALIVLCLAVPTVAGAQELNIAAPGDQDTEITRSGGDIQGGESDAEIYAKAYDVDIQTAEARLQLQADGAGVVTALNARLGEDYAGVWFDNQTGQFVVPVVDRDATADAKAVVRGLGLEIEAARFPVADDTWADLAAAREKLGAALARLDQADGVLLAINPRENQVEVDISEAMSPSAEARARSLATASEVDAVVGVVDPASAEIVDTGCSYAFKACDKPFRAGVAIGANLEPDDCTAAFKALGVGTGNRYVLTAGHCVINNPWATYYSYNYVAPNATAKALGQVESWNLEEGDWATIKVNGFWWDDAANWSSIIASWGVNLQYPITAEAASYVGQLVCHLGRTTGKTCGTVSDVGVENPSEGQRNLTLFKEACAGPGDSGGPVYLGGQSIALGIMKGVIGDPIFEQPPCGQQIGVYSEVTDATTALGVTVGPRLGSAPYARTGSAKYTGSREIQVKGEVAAHGVTSNMYVQYGTTPALGQTTGLFPVASSAWSYQEISPIPVKGLLSNATYYYRLVAQNAAGIDYGDIEQVQTGAATPTATTVPATGVTQSGATMNATVNPEESPATYRFEYGKTDQLGTNTTTQAAGSGASHVPVSHTLTGLAAETTYFYRVRADNVAGFAKSPIYTFTTAAKPLNGFAGTLDGESEFSYPAGIDANAQGEIFFADPVKSKIVRVSSTGQLLGSFGTFGTALGQLKEPRSVSPNLDGNIWVADYGNARLQLFTPSGQFIRAIGPNEKRSDGSPRLLQPTDIASIGNGQMMVTDLGRKNVQIYNEASSSGSYWAEDTTMFGETPAPTSVDGEAFIGVYAVVDEGSDKVMIRNVSPSPGNFSIIGGFQNPSGVAVKRNGNVLVADKGNNRVQMFSRTGELLGSFGTKGSGPGQMSEPSGVASSSRGVTFVADGGNVRVSRWTQQTAPEAESLAPKKAGANGMLMRGHFNASGLPTTYSFQFGAYPALDVTVPAGGLTASGFGSIAAQQTVTGLDQSKPYWFRAAATNAEGTTYGRAILVWPNELVE